MTSGHRRCEGMGVTCIAAVAAATALSGRSRRCWTSAKLTSSPDVVERSLDTFSASSYTLAASAARSQHVRSRRGRKDSRAVRTCEAGCLHQLLCRGTQRGYSVLNHAEMAGLSARGIDHWQATTIAGGLCMRAHVNSITTLSHGLSANPVLVLLTAVWPADECQPDVCLGYHELSVTNTPAL
jgi:hypothetical protein